MDDNFLHLLRRDPSPDFDRRLREQLTAATGPAAEHPRSGVRRWAPGLAAATAALVLGLFVASPSMRASAKEFLDLFRVRSFAAVEVDARRLDRLEGAEIDIHRLLSEHIEPLLDPGQPVEVSSAAAAGAAAGLRVLMPTYLPEGVEPSAILVRGREVARLTADTGRLRELLATLGIDDARVPANLDGAVVTVSKPPTVHIRFQHGDRDVLFLQARAPEVLLPQGVDLAQVGEVGLRVAGLSAAEARRLASTVDWHSTLLVPVPTRTSSFRHVDVRGTRGLLVHSARGISIRETGSIDDEPHPIEGPHGGNLLLWSEGDRVFALAGNVHPVDLLRMASSIE